MSEKLIDIWVPGHPKPKGSLDFYGKGKVRETVDNGPWRALVSTAAERAHMAEPWTGPVSVRLMCWLDHPNPCGPTEKAGDIDKLSRLVLDALTDAKVYQDDNQVYDLEGRKFKANGQPGDSGVWIIVFGYTDEEYREIESFARAARWSVRGVKR